MAIVTTVKYILAQEKISTIGVKLELSCSDISWVVNDLLSFSLIGSLHWQLPYTEQSSTLDT